MIICGSAPGTAETAAPDLKCETSEKPVPSVEAACGAEWSEHYKQLLAEAAKKGLDASAIPKPRNICEKYITDRYPNCSSSIFLLREALHFQKHAADRKSDRAWLGMQVGTWLVAVLGLIVSVAAAYATDARATWRFINIFGAALVTATTTVMAFYDPRDLYAAELKTRTAVTEIQSELEYALVDGGVFVGTGQAEQLEPITQRTIRRWQLRLSEALGQDVAKYLELRGSKSEPGASTAK